MIRKSGINTSNKRSFPNATRTTKRKTSNSPIQLLKIEDEADTLFIDEFPLGFNEFVNIHSNGVAVGSIEYSYEQDILTIYTIELTEENRGKGIGGNAIWELIRKFKPTKLHVVDAKEGHDAFWNKYGKMTTRHSDNEENTKHHYITLDRL